MVDSGNGHPALRVKGFGVDFEGRGPVVAILVVILFGFATLGALNWKMGERGERAITESADRQVGAIKEWREESTRHRGAAQKEHEELVRGTRKLECALWYSPEERLAIRKKIEREPALKDMWCP